MPGRAKYWVASWRRILIPVFCSYLLFQVCCAVKWTKKEGLGEADADTQVSTRDPKNLFPFVWVTFQPTPCGPDTANAIKNGVCIQRGKCGKRGGTVNNGMCRDGFGECCTFTDFCNNTKTMVDVNQLVTTITTQMPKDIECTLRFKKEPNICQIHLYFEEFTMVGANEDGICEQDRLTIRNSKTVAQDFTTCGILTGQHMYLTFGSQDAIEVTPVIRSMTGSYKIIATRIPCDSPNRAPDYCLQYFTTSSGVVKSFDWRTGGQQQSKQKYNVCVKPTGSSTKIMWKQCSAMTPGAGAIGKAFDIINPSIVDVARGDLCTTDWVQVKGCPRQCEVFGPQTSDWKPYELLVNFNEMEIPPPPPSFVVPIDPQMCDPMCMGYSNANYECACMPLAGGNAGDESCVCLQIAPAPVAPMPPVAGPPLVDVNNTGFCLEYMQL